MAKSANQRHLKKRADELGELFKNIPEQFHLAWARFFNERAGEIRCLSRVQQRDDVDVAWIESGSLKC